MIETMPKQITLPTTEEIIINGESRGEVWLRDSPFGGYQCQICHAVTGYITINGSGQTKEDAYKDAIQSGRKIAQKMLDLCSEVEEELA